MAGSINHSVGVNVTNGDITSQFQKTVSVTQTSQGHAAGCQDIGTTEEALVVSDITTSGIGYFMNIDATNFVQLGVVVSATFYPLVRLLAGEVATFRLDTGATIYAKADTADCKLVFQINEA